MAVRHLYLVVLVFWVHVGDLATAWLYDGGTHPEAALLRPARDATVIIVAGLCFASLRMARSLFLPLVAYCALAFCSMLQSLAGGRAIGLVVSSLGTLMIPILFFLVGYYCLRGYREIGALARLYAVIACASAAFGLWEINHTEFWIDTLQYGVFFERVKGVMFGAQPLTGLPWSFYRDTELTRRAAGLLAAPLAQGMFLVIAMLLVVAAPRGMLRRMRLVLAAFLALGIWMAGTRGAMLAGALALTGYLATARSMIVDPRLRLGLAFAAIAGAAFATRDLVTMTWALADGSSPGHWRALRLNLEGLFGIPLLGYGPGAQGGIAAQTGQSVVGGGEGAIFTMAYQVGLPGMAAFLCFYFACLGRLWRARRDCDADFALATFWLMVGMVVTFVTSEHILAVSGSAALWLLMGGQMRALARSRMKENASPDDRMAGALA
jgi:hypothetical protein